MDTFQVDIYTWKVQIYPTGRGAEQNKSFSVFLVLEDDRPISNGRHLFAEFEIILKNKNKGPDRSKHRVAWFTKSDLIHGFEDFIPLVKFTDSEYTKDGSLTIHVHIKKLFRQEDV
ncbi:hypothetical protein SOVF_160030 [Spinacia oleracea]|nr:hypothetical protein SOVF_160030 [Spinacia oleracea]